MDPLKYELTIGGTALSNDEQKEFYIGPFFCMASLYGLRFERSLYKPGHIQAEVFFQGKLNDTVGMDLLRDGLIGKPVSLAVAGTTVASGYFVYEISPQLELKKKETVTVSLIGGGGKKVKVTFYYYDIYVKLDIFSPDIRLMMNKFSRVYPAKKFISQVVTDFVGIPAINVPLRPLASSSLQGLAYTDNSAQVEYVQPYLVQYNESFYDFIKRVSNRCGEAFYFENGMLCFGLLKGGKSKKVAGASRIIFQHITGAPLSIRDYARDSVKGTSYDKTTGKYTYGLGKHDIHSDPVGMDSHKCPADAFPLDGSSDDDYADVYNSEIASEDQYMILYKDKFEIDDFKGIWWGDSAEHAMKIVSDILNSTSLLEILSKLGTKLFTGLIAAAKKKQRANDDGNEIISDATKPSGVTDYAVLFSGVSKDSSQWITLKKYHDIRVKEEQVIHDTVCVDMGEGFFDANLGDRITIPGCEGQTYIVTRVDMTSSNEWKRTYEGFTGDAAPAGGKPSQLIYAVPLVGDVFYPPLLPDKPFRQSGPQPAFIVDSGDPIGQGRVRIRFAWQPLYNVKKYQDEVATYKKVLLKYGSFNSDGKYEKKSGLSDADKAEVDKYKPLYDSACQSLEDASTSIKSEASPWIRMTTPLASPESGMYFKPQKGDEVMVDFENGNIERPYVTGALYSKNVPVPRDGNMVIVSRNGHTFKMSDPKDLSEFIAGLYPGIKYLKSLGVKTDMMDLEGDARKILGGIELTDKYGFYNIKMSTHDRNISISSPVGDVKMSALTGISIDAPNGDISIRGKNVSITAYNKISVESGKNVKNGMGGWIMAFADGKEVGKSVAKTVLNSFGGKFFDLSLIRSLVEIFIRPIDGTLQIKSNRFMQLEAGKGKSSADGSMYHVKVSDRFSKFNEGVILKNVMLWLKERIDLLVDDFVPLFNKVAQEAIACSTQGFFGNAAPAIVSTPDSADNLLKALFNEQVQDTEVGFQNVKDAFLGNAHKLTILPAANVQDGLYRQKTVKAYIGNLFRAINDLRVFIRKIDNIFDSPTDKTGRLSHVKDFLTAYPSFKAIALSILKMDNPDVAAVAAAARPAAIPPAQPSTKDPAVGGTSGLWGDVIEKINDFANSGQASLFQATTVQAFNSWKTLVTRRLMSQVIETCRVNNQFKSFMIPLPGYFPTIDPVALTPVPTHPDNFAHPFSDADWAKYIKEIRIVDVPQNLNWGQNFLGGLKDGVMDSVGKLQVWPEISVWKSDSEGEILFSDKKDKTYQFKNGLLESHVSQSRDMASDESALKGVMN